MGFYDVAMGLMAYYPFNRNNLLDDVTGRLGTVSQPTVSNVPSASTSTVPYTGGQSAVFSQAASQSILLPAVTLPDPFTVCEYHYYNSGGNAAGGPAVFHFGNTAVNPTDYTLFYNNAGENYLRFRASTSNVFMGDLLTNNTFSAKGSWYHYCAAWSGKTTSLWYNGQPYLINQSPSGGDLTNPRSAVRMAYNYLGRNAWSAATNTFWDGYIDEFMIYNRVLTNSEVAAIYSFRNVGGNAVPIIPVSCSPSCLANTYGRCTPSGTAVCCGAGTYFVEGYSSTCEPCPPGTYGLGNTVQCTPCAAGLNSPAGASACAAAYPVYALVTDWSGGTVRKVDVASGATTTVVASLSNPAGVAVSPNGDFALVTSVGTHKIFKINMAAGTSTVLAGSGTAGAVDAVGTAASLNSPIDIKISPDGTYALFGEQNNNCVRKISLLDGSVTRIAGSGTSTGAYAEGTGTNALFNWPEGIDISADGSFALVTEYSGHRVRKLPLSGGGTVTSSLVAGSASAAIGSSGAANGAGTSATFSNPQGVVISSDMTFALVADRGNSMIRKVILSSPYTVSTLTTITGAQTVGVSMSALGDFLIVTGLSLNRVYQVTYPGGTATAIAGDGTAAESNNAVGTSAQFNGPHGLTMWKCSILGYGMSTTSASCAQCPAGTYGSGNGRCTPCAAGTYSVGVGLRSGAECLACAANTYAVAGATACVLCSSVSANSWSGVGAGVCMPNAGYYDLGGNLMAYYPFNSGNVLTDVSGVSGLLKTSASSPTSQTTGPFGAGSYSVAFVGGSSQFFSLPSFTFSSAFTICTWYYIESSVTPNYQVLYSFSTSVMDAYDIISYLNPSSTQIKVSNIWSSASVGDLAITGATATKGGWYHLAVAVSGTSGTAWINGAQSSTITYTSARTPMSLQYNTLGTKAVGAGASNHWTGAFDEFRVYNRALSSSEITTIYNFQGNTASTNTVLMPLGCTISGCTSPSTARCLSSGSGICCAAGTYFVEGTTSSCLPCPAGTYSTTGGQIACTKCSSSGYYSTSATSAVCVACAAGSGAVGGVCVRDRVVTVGSSFCPGGSYYDGTSSCIVCKAGKYAAAGATACTDCPANTASVDGAATCKANAGYYANSVLLSTLSGSGAVPATISGTVSQYVRFTSAGGTVTFTQEVKAQVLVVGGGGSGGTRQSGGGGGGAVIYSTYTFTAGSSYTIAVGAGGAGIAASNSATASGNDGGDSTISLGGTVILKAKGGGGGAPNVGSGRTGGCSGGSSGNTVQVFSPAVSTANVPSGAYGYIGGSGSDASATCTAVASGDCYAGGGGGGAGAAGSPARNYVSASVPAAGGAGGNGLVSSITGSAVVYGAGGGGGGDNSLYSTGGPGGGGYCSGVWTVSGGAGGAAGGTTLYGNAAAPNTGSGGGGSGWDATTAFPASGAGSDGVVIIAWESPAAITQCPANTGSQAGAAGCVPAVGYYLAQGSSFLSSAMSASTAGATTATQTIGGESVTVTTSSVYSVTPVSALFDNSANDWSPSGARYSTGGDGAYTANTFATLVDGVSYSGEWNQIGFQTARQLGVYSLTAQSGGTYYKRAPANFIIAGSSNNGAWTMIDIQTSIAWTTSAQVQSFAPSPSMYRKFTTFRLIIRASAGATDGYTSVAEWALYAGTPTTCTSATCAYPTPYSHCTVSGSAVCCGAGTYWAPSTNAAGCTPCPLGMYGDGSSTFCTACAAGTFSGFTGASACQTCASGLTSDAGAAVCSANAVGQAAPLGQYYNATLAAYTACPSGFTCAGSAAQPVACPGGSWCTTNTSIVCTSCAAGQYVATSCTPTTDATCSPCAVGTYSTSVNLPSAGQCTLCDAGTYSTGAGIPASQCSLCGAGTYSSALGAISTATCTSCAAGSYSSSLGLPAAGQCTLCAAGAYSTVLGAIAVATCTGCSAGAYSTGSGMAVASACQTCTDCVAGQKISTLCSATTNRVCASCTGGTDYTTALNQGTCAACTLCTSGQSRTTACIVSANTVCTPCTAGNYCPNTAASTVTPCTANNYCLANVAAPAPCSACTAGNYIGTACSSTANTVCSPCGTGTSFTNTSNAAACTACSACVSGQFTATSCIVTANVVCQQCPAGSYCANPATGVTGTCTAGTDYCLAGSVTKATCSVCAAGNYRTNLCTATANTVCAPCVARTSFSTTSNAASCTACGTCAGGQYVSSFCTTSSNIVCAGCPQGNFCPDSANSTVTPCASTYYCAANSVAQTKCLAGSYCPNTYTQSLCTSGDYCPTGSTAKTQCATGFYCPNTTSQIACTSYCPAGSTAQNPCAPGFYCSDALNKVACTLGNYCPTGTVSQSLCAAGSYCTNTSVQIACSAGYFCPAGSTAQTICALGSYCTNTSSQVVCGVGYYCPAGTVTLQLCPVGYACVTPSSSVTCDVFDISEKPYPPQPYDSVTAPLTTTYFENAYRQEFSVSPNIPGRVFYGYGSYYIWYPISTFQPGYNAGLLFKAPDSFYRSALGSFSNGNFTGSSSIDSIYKGVWFMLKSPDAFPFEIAGFRFHVNGTGSAIAYAPAEWKLYGSPTGATFTEITSASSVSRLTAADYTDRQYLTLSNKAYTKFLNSPVTYKYIVFIFGKLVGGQDSLALNFIEILGPDVSVLKIPDPGQAIRCLAGSTAPEPCPVGMYCPNATAFSPCTLSYYCASGSPAQSICESGYVCPSTSTKTLCNSTYYCPSGSTSQTICAAGSYCTNTSTQTACTSGNYCPAGSLVQTPCLLGSYCPNTSTQLLCTQGNWCPVSSTAQTPCPASSYCTTPSQKADCTLGNYCPLSSTSQTACALGSYCSNTSSKIACASTYYCPSSSTAQTKCLVGSYCTNSSSQVACSSTYYCPQGSTSQTTCLLGSVCTTPSTQTGCASGSWCPSGTVTESACPLGSYCSTPSSKTLCVAPNYCASRSTQSLPCPVGFYCPDPLNKTACPANKYCLSGVTTGANCSVCSSGQYVQSVCLASANIVCPVCTNLPAHATYTGVGTAVSDCPWICDNGYYLSGGQCAACPPGSWCAANVQNTCPTNANSSALSYAQNSCLCKAGYAGDGSVSGTSPCPVCRAGFYCPGGNSNISIACPGNFSSPIGSSAYSSCQCVPGFLRVGETCQLCGPGQICISGQLSTCPINSLAPGGSSSASDCVCNPGFYGQNGFPCTQCAANSYCPGGNVITSCTTNAVSPAQSTNATACYCDRGYQGVANAACSSCVANTWCWTGVLNSCPANTVSPPLSSRWINCTCIPGYTGPDGTACTACAAGSYKTAGGSASCTNCPLNNYCPTAAITPTPCPIAHSNSPLGSLTAAQCVCDAGYFGASCGLCTVAYFCPGGPDATRCPNDGYTVAGAVSASNCVCPTNSGPLVGTVSLLRTCNGNNSLCPLFASSTNPVEGATSFDIANAADGNPSTQWFSNSKTNGFDWVRVDFQKSQSITSLRAVGNVLYTDRLKRFMVHVGYDPTYPGNNTLVYTSPNVVVLDETATFPAAVGRYVFISVSDAFAGSARMNLVEMDVRTNFDACTCSPGYERITDAASPAGWRCDPCAADRYCSAGVSTACPLLSTAPMYSNSSAACQCGDGYYMGGGVCVRCGYGTYSIKGAVGACSPCPSNSNTSSIGSAALSQCKCLPGFVGDAIVLSQTVAVSLINSCNNLQCPMSAYSTFGGWLVQSAVDGTLGNTWHSGGADPVTGYNWWRIDFQTQKYVSRGTIWNGVGNTDRMDHFQIWVGDDGTFPGTNRLTYYSPSTLVTSEAYTSNAFGRYLYVACNSSQYLRIGEIEILFDESRACGVCYKDQYCPGGQVNYTITCPNSQYSLVGASTVSQCGCPVSATLLPNVNCTCNNGTYKVLNVAAPLGGWQCDACPATKYCQLGSAVACPAGYSCPANTVNPVVCPLGYYCIASSSTPVACPAGTYAPSTGTTSLAGCLPCGYGYYSTASGSSVCAACQINTNTTVTNANAASQCVCDPGYYMTGGVCANCGYGTYSARGAVSTCTACPASSNTSGIGSVGYPQCICVAGYSGQITSASSTGCQPCVANSYCLGAQVNYVTPCPDSKYSLIGSSSASQCGCPVSATLLPSLNCTCNNGTYKVLNGTAPLGGWQCSSCPATKYCQLGNAVACPAGYSCPASTVYPVVCPKGSYCPASLATPTPCPVGTYAPTTGAASLAGCLPCGFGRYAVAAGSSVCATCPLNTNTTVTDAALVSQCVCDPGYFMSGGVCVRCGHGTYSARGAVTACTSCPANSNTTALGASVFGQCMCVAGFSGEIVSASDNVGCTQCGVNKYCPGGQVNLSVTCPNATFSYTGASSPSQCMCPTDAVVRSGACVCMDGTYKVMNPASLLSGWQCDACPAGSNCLNGVQSSCPAGYFCSPQSIGPVICPVGAYCLQSVSQPTLCPAGTYNAFTGATTEAEGCIPCGNGYYSTVQGSTQCSGCQLHSNTTVLNAQAQSQCVCDAGYAMIAGVCTQCGFAVYSAQGASGACTSCPAHSNTTARGSTVASQCICGVGYKVNATGGCDTCPADSYCPGEGLSTACPTNLYSLAGSVDVSQCRCPVSSHFASSGCVCDNGYSRKTNAAAPLAGWECTTCAAGSLCINGTVAPCAVGYSCANGAASVCPVNRYCPEGIAASLACPINAHAAAGSASCTCDDGYLSSVLQGAHFFAFSAESELAQLSLVDAADITYITDPSLCRIGKCVLNTNSANKYHASLSTAVFPTGAAPVFTLAFWMNLQSANPWRGLVELRGANFLGTADYMELFSMNTLTDAETQGPGAAAFSEHPAFFELNAWHHVAITFSHGYYTLYRDGVSVFSKQGVWSEGAITVLLLNQNAYFDEIYFVASELLPSDIATLHSSNSLCGPCGANGYCAGGVSFSCPVGAVSPPASTSTSACACAAGYYSVSGACVLCPAGRFCSGGSVSASTSSGPCPAGSYCLAGVTSPAPCSTTDGE